MIRDLFTPQRAAVKHRLSGTGKTTCRIGRSDCRTSTCCGPLKPLRLSLLHTRTKMPAAEPTATAKPATPAQEQKESKPAQADESAVLESLNAWLKRGQIRM